MEQMLSPPQRVLLKKHGYPQLFIKTFRDEDGSETVHESWIYTREGLVEYFIDGVYVEEHELKTQRDCLPSWDYRPEDYTPDITTQTVIALHGPPKDMLDISPAKGGFFRRFPADVYYVYNDIVFGFHKDKLTSVFPSN